MKKTVKKILASLSDKMERYFGHKNEIKKQRDKRRKKLIKSVHLSKEQKHQIDCFYKQNYGKKINCRWHKLYTAISGNFDYKYVPEYFYMPDFQRLTNDKNYCKVFADKNVLPQYIKSFNLGIVLPKTIAYCSNGVFYDSNNNVVDISNIISILLNKTFFIKPSIDSNSGKNCVLIKEKEYTAAELEKVLLSYKGNFVAQKIVKNQEDISRINSSSLNTFRVVSYWFNHDIHVCPIVLRCGTNGNVCDNAHAGGVFVAVSDDGTIVSNGKTEFGGDYEKHPDSNITFKGYNIKNVDKIKDAAIKLHRLFPKIGFIDWDLTLDENEEVVLIEANTYGGSFWMAQMAHGKSMLGDDAAELLKMIKRNKKTY